LENQEKDIEKNKDYLEYLTESCPYIFKYVELEDREKEILQNITIKNEDELNRIKLEKNKIAMEYCKTFNIEYTPFKVESKKEMTHCNECNEEYFINEGLLICPKCGIAHKTIELHSELSYKELRDLDYRPQFTYEKMSHFEDWLKRFEAKEKRMIPKELIEDIITEARKERIEDLNLLTEEKVKKYLKKLKRNEYYDNIISIINIINKRQPFKLTPEITEKLKQMFSAIQEPYNKHKPKERKNFLSYSYTLHKFFQILKLPEFSKYFPLLKSPDKLRQQDEIFKKIVNEMKERDKTIQWIFIPSI
jgi:Zn finger protein HypA/HybF involved in hydrogenase expression